MLLHLISGFCCFSIAFSFTDLNNPGTASPTSLRTQNVAPLASIPSAMNTDFQIVKLKHGIRSKVSMLRQKQSLGE